MPATDFRQGGIKSQHNEETFLMTKTEEKKLEKFLKETFGSRWEFTWKGEEDGFSLSLDVWRTDNFEKAVIEANKT